MKKLNEQSKNSFNTSKTDSQLSKQLIHLKKTATYKVFTKLFFHKKIDLTDISDTVKKIQTDKAYSLDNLYNIDDNINSENNIQKRKYANLNLKSKMEFI